MYIYIYILRYNRPTAGASMSALPERREPSPVQPAAAVSTHPLKNSRFRRLWIGSAISLFGDQFYLVALPWVVLQITGSAVAMGTILMAASIPRAILMLMGGAVADRLSPRRILLRTAFGRALV